MTIPKVMVGHEPASSASQLSAVMHPPQRLATPATLRATLWYVLSSAATVILAISLLHATHRLANAGLALLLVDALMAGYLLRAASRVLATPAFNLLTAMLDPRPLRQSFKRMLLHVSTH